MGKIVKGIFARATGGRRLKSLPPLPRTGFRSAADHHAGSPGGATVPQQSAILADAIGELFGT